MPSVDQGERSWSSSSATSSPARVGREKCSSTSLCVPSPDASRPGPTVEPGRKRTEDELLLELGRMHGAASTNPSPSTSEDNELKTIADVEKVCASTENVDEDEIERDMKRGHAHAHPGGSRPNHEHSSQHPAPPPPHDYQYEYDAEEYYTEDGLSVKASPPRPPIRGGRPTPVITSRSKVITSPSNAEVWYNTVRERQEADLANALRSNGWLVEELKRKTDLLDAARQEQEAEAQRWRNERAELERDAAQKVEALEGVLEDLRAQFANTKLQLEHQAEAKRRVCEAQCETMREEVAEKTGDMKKQDEQIQHLRQQICNLCRSLQDNRDATQKALLSAKDAVVSASKKAQDNYREWKSQQKTQWPLDKLYFSRLQDALHTIELRCTRLLVDTEKRFGFLQEDETRSAGGGGHAAAKNVRSSGSNVVNAGRCGPTGSSSSASSSSVRPRSTIAVPQSTATTSVSRSSFTPGHRSSSCQSPGRVAAPQKTRTMAAAPQLNKVKNKCLNLFLDDSVLSETAAETYLNKIVERSKQEDSEGVGGGGRGGVGGRVVKTSYNPNRYNT
ncbi:unnamed protein product [Amoebophrya sp. A120]|nr:unnamed protein product [Amoebophrya sp. A120]|eukprot:GSA120T00011536001.1